jgi:hypothetical protein
VLQVVSPGTVALNMSFLMLSLFPQSNLRGGALNLNFVQQGASAVVKAYNDVKNYAAAAFSSGTYWEQASAYVGSYFYDKPTVMQTITSYFSTLGPVGWSITIGIGLIVTYKIARSIHTRYFYTRINEMDSGFDLDKMDTDMLTDFSTNGAIFSFNKDYEFLFKTHSPKHEIQDILTFARKLSKVSFDEMGKNDKDTLQTFDKLWNDLEPYTLTNKKNRAERLQDLNNSDLDISLSEATNNMEKYQLSNQNFNSIAQTYSLYTYAGRFVSNNNNNELGINTSTANLKAFVVAINNTNPAKGWAEEFIKDLINFLTGFWKYELERNKLLNGIQIKINETTASQMLDNTEISKIEALNVFLRSHNVDTFLNKLNLNSFTISNLTAEKIVFTNLLTTQIAKRVVNYKLMNNMCNYIRSKSTTLLKYELDTFMMNIQKLLFYHFKLKYPAFAQNFKENNFIIDLKDFNTQPKKDENMILVTNDTMFELISEKSILDVVKTKRKKIKSNLNNEDLKGVTMIDNGIVHNTQVFFKKFSQKTEITPSEIEIIKNQVAEEIEFKNIPFIQKAENFELFYDLVKRLRAYVIQDKYQNISYFASLKSYFISYLPGFTLLKRAFSLIGDKKTAMLTEFESIKDVKFFFNKLIANYYASNRVI